MRKLLFVIALSVLSNFVFAKTLVKLSVPKQSEQELKVVVLFDEPVPEGVPIVLGLMAYEVSGGQEPYTYEWLQNGKIIGTGDIAVITPSNGDEFTLKAIDKNNCYSVQSFNMKVVRKLIQADSQANKRFSVYPTIINNKNIEIKSLFSKTSSESTVVIYDSKGGIVFSESITNFLIINKRFENGAYFIIIKSGDYCQVEKIIVKNN